MVPRQRLQRTVGLHPIPARAARLRTALAHNLFIVLLLWSLLPAAPVAGRAPALAQPVAPQPALAAQTAPPEAADVEPPPPPPPPAGPGELRLTLAAPTLQPGGAVTLTVSVAAAQLQQAELRYLQRIATPTPTPTHTPTPVPSPPLTTAPYDAEVHSLVSGVVVGVEIVSVTGNETTVEARIAVGAQTGNEPPAQAGPPTYALPPPASELACVIHVSDGDTLDGRFSDDSEERLRLLDVDTPETVHPDKPVQCYGPQASSCTKQRLWSDESGKNCVGIGVYVEEASREKYGRLLAYAWTQDGALFNGELAALDLARYNDYGERHQFTAVKAAARQAQVEHSGLWGACPVN